MILDIPWEYIGELAMIAAVMGYSQYLPFRAGVFSLATAGFVEIGAFANAWATTNGYSALLGALFGVAAATVVAVVLAVPLSRLRGVFQGIATIAFLQIVQEIAFVWTPVTGGPLGIVGIPNWATFWPILAILVVLSFVLWRFEKSPIGQKTTAVRVDELAAASSGIQVVRYHLWALVVSGALGGLAGVLLSANQFAITPDGFGFALAIAIVSYVFIGGFRTWAGALFGACFLVALPQVLRPLQGYQLLVNGVLLIAVMVFLQRGVVDTVRGGFSSLMSGRAARG